MSISITDMVFMRPQVSDNTSSNGGRMTNTQINMALRDALIPSAGYAERISGSTIYRKVFYKNNNAADLVLYNAKLYLDLYTEGGDSVVAFPGTQSDTQATITGSEQVYGCAQLNANAAAGATSIQVQVEDTAGSIFADGMLIRVSDKANPNAGTGNAEYIVINGAPSVAGSIWTLTLSSPGLVNSYNAANTRVAGIMEMGDIAGSVDTPVVTSAAGTLDVVTNPIVVPNVGALYQTYTLTFTSSTAFNVTGDTLGSLGAGSRSSNLSPINPNTGTPYFTLPSAAFGGSYLSGDTIVFTTTPSAMPLWLKRVIPANTDSLAGNMTRIAVDGESA